MTLEGLFSQIDQLTPNELERLWAYLDQKRRERRLEAFDEAVAALQEGLTPEQVEEIKQAMAEDYIEPVDVDQWRD